MVRGARTRAGDLSAAAVLAELDAAHAEHPDLARAIAVEAALRAAAGAEGGVPEGWLARARERLARGDAALDGDDAVLDPASLLRLAADLCAVAARHDPVRADACARAARYLGDAEAGAIPPDVDAGLLALVAAHALRGRLAPYAAATTALVAAAPWGRPRCPLCGAAPDLAALEEEGGTRRLLCARCDTEWTGPRSGCPFCAVPGPGGQAYFTVEGDAYRLYVCDACGGYLKTIDLRATWRRRPLVVERLLTAGLDVAARARGYHPG